MSEAWTPVLACALVLSATACSSRDVPPPAPARFVALDTIDAGTRLMVESAQACRDDPHAACDSLFDLARRLVVVDGAEIEHDSLYPPPWEAER